MLSKYHRLLHKIKLNIWKRTHAVDMPKKREKHVRYLIENTGTFCVCEFANHQNWTRFSLLNAELIIFFRSHEKILKNVFCTTQINKRISLKCLIVRKSRSFFFNVVIYSRLVFQYYIYIILKTIQLDWVTIYCFKKPPSKSGKIDIKCSPYAGSNKA